MKNLTYFFVVFTFGVFDASAQQYSEPYYTVDGLAIQGYDPVAFFTEKKAQPGKSEISYEWSGTRWLFVSEENKQLFKEAPEDYAPQYGGYCAWGMSKGYKAKVDPENAWTIVDDKLYLNYSTSIKKKWLPEKEKLIQTANENWKKY